MKKVVLILMMAGCGVNDMPPGQSYLGTRYMESPLGEGRAPDVDPLIRFDAFDCTTFVETVLADGDVDTLNQIRYRDGEIGFETRNHFIESDWLANNANRVENVSAKYAKTKMRNLVIDKEAWFRTVHKLDISQDTQSVSIEYIPYENLAGVKIDKTMIVLFVTDNPKFRDTIGTDLAVVHMGFVMENGVMRHASSEHGCVVDVDFDEYVAKRMKNKNNLGIVLLGIK